MAGSKDLNKEELEGLIRKIEQDSELQVRVVIAESSGAYEMAFVRLGLVLAFVFTMVLELLWIPLPRSVMGLIYLSLGLLPPLILSNRFLHRWMILPYEVEVKTRKRALFFFYKLDIDRTRSKTGVLFFYSSLERKLVVLADEKVLGALKESGLKKIVKMCTKETDGNAGLKQALNYLYELGKAELPRAADKNYSNELPDAIVYTS